MKRHIGRHNLQKKLGVHKMIDARKGIEKSHHIQTDRKWLHQHKNLKPTP